MLMLSEELSPNYTLKPYSLPSDFSFYCSASHRDPPSFPTRRSSDLGCDRPGARKRAHKRCRTRRDERCDGRARPRPSPLDRKSTRLNSSHRTISYAVFCLKKKNVSATKVIECLITSDEYHAAPQMLQ